MNSFAQNTKFYVYICFGQSNTEGNDKWRSCLMDYSRRGRINQWQIEKASGWCIDKQAKFKFDAQDIRFTIGKNGALYAFCMNVPAPNAQIKIKSLAINAKYLDKKIKIVKLLGYNGKLQWKRKQEADDLNNLS